MKKEVYWTWNHKGHTCIKTWGKPSPWNWKVEQWKRWRPWLSLIQAASTIVPKAGCKIEMCIIVHIITLYHRCCIIFEPAGSHTLFHFKRVKSLLLETGSRVIISRCKHLPYSDQDSVKSCICWIIDHDPPRGRGCLVGGCSALFSILKTTEVPSPILPNTPLYPPNHLLYSPIIYVQPVQCIISECLHGTIVQIAHLQQSSGQPGSSDKRKVMLGAGRASEGLPYTMLKYLLEF